MRKPVGVGIDWMWTKITGKKLMMIGPANAGKTLLARYVKTGQLFSFENLPRYRTLETYQAMGATKINSSGARRVLTVSSLIDMPGDLDPSQVCEEIELHGPHVLVNVFDAQMPLDDVRAWQEGFWAAAERVLVHSTRRTIKVFLVVFNKWDTLPAGSEDIRFQSLSSALKGVVDNANLRGFGFHAESINYARCSLVKDFNKEAFPSDVVQNIGLGVEHARDSQ